MAAASQVKVVALDHIVLNVADVERALAFYCGTLGLAPVRVDEWRRGEVPFPSARVDGGTIIDLLAVPRSGENADHFCLVVEPTDWDAVKASGNFEVVDGPARRYGARGDGTSLYVRDPDGNVVELRHYGDVRPVLERGRPWVRLLAHPDREEPAMAVIVKSFDSPDQSRNPEKTQIATVSLGSADVARMTMEPGWKWSDCIKPVAGTDSCQKLHLGVALSGNLHVVHDDGGESDIGPGDAYVIEPGHDGWVIGDEPFVGYEFESTTATTFATPAGG